MSLDASDYPKICHRWRGIWRSWIILAHQDFFHTWKARTSYSLLTTASCQTSKEGYNRINSQARRGENSRAATANVWETSLQWIITGEEILPKKTTKTLGQTDSTVINPQNPKTSRCFRLQTTLNPKTVLHLAMVEAFTRPPHICARHKQTFPRRRAPHTCERRKIVTQTTAWTLRSGSPCQARQIHFSQPLAYARLTTRLDRQCNNLHV